MPQNKSKERGAQLACIAALSTKAMESAEAQTVAQRLAEQCLTGLIAWRRGAFKIYAHNLVDDSTGKCKERILALLDDEDQQVQQHIGFIFYQLLSRSHLLVTRLHSSLCQSETSWG